MRRASRAPVHPARLTWWFRGSAGAIGWHMNQRPTATVWIGSAFCAALVLCSMVLTALGTGERGTLAALQVTARLSFILFWPAYAGSALTALLGPIFQPLKQRAREFGLAFASAHLVHIGLVGWLTHIGAGPSFGPFVFFWMAVAGTFLISL